MRLKAKSLLFILFSVAISACAGNPPIQEYNIARTALNAAREAEAPRYSAGFWHKAEENYQLGQKAYAENDFASAKVKFENSIGFAEKAENATRLKKFQSGEGVP